MTDLSTICNRSLQVLGTRTTVALSELGPTGTPQSNEAIQFNLIFDNMRDDLLRMAPWNCAKRTANLTFITSQPGTPENVSASTTLWQPGQPSPPWSYEYQYPADCLRPCYIIPSTQTGFVGGVPITTAVTGGASSYWWGQPIRYQVASDTFYSVSAAAIANGGSGYAVGDLITVALSPAAAAVTNRISTFNAGAPQGAAAILQVTSAPGGVISAVSVVSQVPGEATPQGGSYFYTQANPVTQGSTTGAGSGATFNLTFVSTPTPQRVILCNQEFATLSYIQQITDPNLMDSLFQTAWINLIAAALCMGLKEDKRRANDLLKIVNEKIQWARTGDGNEGLTVNDVTPDWINVRGVAYNEGYLAGPYDGYDWGSFFPMY